MPCAGADVASRCAAVPGTQVFLADDAAASALTAKRKWWHTAQQLWVRTAPHRCGTHAAAPLTTHVFLRR
jgi:hypothetical protein